MYGNINACKRALSLAYLIVTTSLCPLAVHAQQANTTTELPAVEVIAEEGNGTGTGTGVGKEGDLNTTPDSLYQTPLGQVETTIPAGRMINTKAFSVFDVLRDSPGVS